MPDLTFHCAVWCSLHDHPVLLLWSEEGGRHVALDLSAEQARPLSSVSGRSRARLCGLLLAAHALGLGAIWRTGDPAYDPTVKAFFGLAPTATAACRAQAEPR